MNSLFKESGDPKLVSYYAFESVSTNYYNKKGELVTCKRCARVDKKATIDQLNAMLKGAAKAYLSHRYFIGSHNAFWP